ncbi:hypothetical protein ONZ45_g16873 [Pleurotus djamor]|nr:hypothetical protein ONZ45_g16873 [Pleurotus djamor]
MKMTLTTDIQAVEAPTKWKIHQLKPLPFFVSGKVALVGDSVSDVNKGEQTELRWYWAQAHAMVPHQGAGAGQAIEDAYIIASLLSQTETEKVNIEAALLAYEHIRLRIANHVLNGSRESGKMYEFDSIYGEDYRVLGSAIEQQWDWINWPAPEEDLRAAVASYAKLLQGA